MASRAVAESEAVLGGERGRRGPHGAAHAGADDLQRIDDLERTVAFLRAHFSVVGVIDRDQRIDAGGSMEDVL
jgi:hypothetical protein